MSKLILVTLGVRPIGFVGVDVLTGVIVVDLLLRLISSRGHGILYCSVEAEFERAGFFSFSPCFASGSIIKKRMSLGSINFSVKPLGCLYIVDVVVDR